MSEDNEQQRDVGKIWGALRELAAVVWGDDRTRDNGIRSEVRTHATRLESLERGVADMKTEALDMWNVRRRNECLGIAALGEHKKDHEKKEGDNVEITKIKIQSSAQLKVNTIITAGAFLAAIANAVAMFLKK